MGVFLMCWLPFFLLTTFLSFHHVYMPLSLNELVNWLALTNSTLNPFIYAFFYSWFRSAFKMIISGKIFQGDFSNSKLFWFSLPLSPVRHSALLGLIHITHELSFEKHLWWPGRSVGRAFTPDTEAVTPLHRPWVLLLPVKLHVIPPLSLCLSYHIFSLPINKAINRPNEKRNIIYQWMKIK